jgi:hypothetical protein
MRATSLNNLGCLFRHVGKPHAALRQVEMVRVRTPFMSQSPPPRSAVGWDYPMCWAN